MSSMTLSAPVSAKTRPVAWGRYALIALATLAAAALANTLVYYLADAVVAFDPRFDILTTVGPTVTVTLQAGVIAALLYAALLRFSANPARTFTLVSAVVFVVTLLPDFLYIPTVAGASAAQTGVLVLMHAVAAAVIVPLFTTYAHPDALAARRSATR